MHFVVTHGIFELTMPEADNHGRGPWLSVSGIVMYNFPTSGFPFEPLIKSADKYI